MLATRIDAAELSRMLGDWSDGPQTLPETLAAALVNLIVAGFVPAGSALPAQRDCATALGVSRGTVAAAYGALEARGLLVSLQGSGTRVRSGSNQAPALVEGRLFSFTHTPVPDVDCIDQRGSNRSRPGDALAAARCRRAIGPPRSAHLSSSAHHAKEHECQSTPRKPESSPTSSTGAQSSGA